MEDLTTKQKIARESLILFSQQGYDAVSVRDIARAVGIKESSLYNHFKNKQDIFDSIVCECCSIADRYFEDMNVAQTFSDTNTNIANRYKEMDDGEFLSVSIGLFQHYLQDENLVKFRKLLTIEQFNNPRVREIYRKIFIQNMLDYHSTLFKLLIEYGVFVEADPDALAIQFYAPVFLLYYQYDELDDEASDILISHIIQFKQTYTAAENLD